VSDGGNTYTHALVRPPGESFAKAISSRGLKLDVALARQQHTGYCEALRTAGFTVESLPADETHPDSCFIQDPAIVVAGHGILCRMGAASRAGEPDAVAGWLSERFPVSRIKAPGTLEGGDVIILPGRLIVGRSARTNAAGIAHLVTILAPLSIGVTAVPVTNYLHLLTAVTYVGHNVMLVLEGSGFDSHPAFAGFDSVIVPLEEAGAADALGTSDTAILPEGCPRTTAALRSRGFRVLDPPLSAFADADGGVTCLSLVW